MANLRRTYIANSVRVFYGDDYGSALHAKLLSEIRLLAHENSMQRLLRSPTNMPWYSWGLGATQTRARSGVE